MIALSFFRMDSYFYFVMRASSHHKSLFNLNHSGQVFDNSYLALTSVCVHFRPAAVFTPSVNHGLSAPSVFSIPAM